MNSEMEQICGYLEYTNLSREICSKDIDLMLENSLKYKFMGICIPPYWVKKVARDKPADLTLITVVGFPFGYHLTETKVAETEAMIRFGAQEIDLAMNISAFKSGAGNDWVKPEVAKIAKICHQNDVVLKLIIETTFLSDTEIIAACKIGADGGADFIKTSTGVGTPPISSHTIALIKQNIPASVAIKASGGIADLKQAKQLIEAGADRLGTSKAVAIAEQELIEKN